MTTEVASSSLIADEMAIVLQNLSPDLRQQVFDFAEFLAQRQDKTEVVKPKRIRDLNRGAVLWISNDFDDPLPDEFWFSDTDPLMMTSEQIKTLNQRR
jgi:hypothetical protein